MSQLAIRAVGLGKQYHIGSRRQDYRTLREAFVDAFAAPVRRAGKLLRGHATGAAELDEVFWALKDVSFEIHHGEVVGIIGPNGAGKSTLLKILSRITEPTEGYAEIRGRIGSLLEVGTGFHPELTGRENIYLNGAILGMRRREIVRKFDEIVAFAEIEKFLDTPVKHYSSGMHVRLAFAVAAHLDPEILLVDEVLAVGDVAFQKKCMGKLGHVARAGRTVLFVSHNMAAVSHLCSRSILLEHGQIKSMADTESVIQAYVQGLDAHIHSPIGTRTDREGSGRLRFSDLQFQSHRGENIAAALSGQPVRLVIKYRAPSPTRLQNVQITAHFLDMSGQRLFAVGTNLSGYHFEQVPSEGCFVCLIPRLLLVEDLYRIDLWASVNGEVADYVQHAASLTVVSKNTMGSAAKLTKRKHGTFVMPHTWELNSSLMK